MNMQTKNTKKSKKGFTLTEVLVVVLIIGVISAIAYPVYTKSINKSRAVEAINLLEMVRNKQIANHARKGEYLPNFTAIGQLTSNPEAEVKTEGDAILTVNGKYELAMNNEKNCMSAAYIPAKGKPATFTFSSSYEDAGLGCDGDICKTFGNIVGTSQSICNCGTKTCSSPYVQNAKTCACDCPLACTEGGCHDKNPARTETQACGNGGTQTRTCPESCSSECSASWSSCTGQTCDGNSSEPCDAGYSGTKTRTCNNGVWSGWNTSGCTKNPIECEGSATEDCENCGTKSRTCDKTTGTWSDWSDCEGTKDETQACDNGYPGNKSRTCTNNIWGEWTGDCSFCGKEGSCKPGENRLCGGSEVVELGTQSCGEDCQWARCICRDGFNLEGDNCVPCGVEYGAEEYLGLESEVNGAADTCPGGDAENPVNLYGGPLMVESCIDIYKKAAAGNGNMVITEMGNVTDPARDTTYPPDPTQKYSCNAQDFAKSATYTDVYDYKEAGATSVFESVRVKYCNHEYYPADACCGTMWFVSRCDWYRNAGGNISHSYAVSPQEYCKDMARIGKVPSGGSYSCWSMDSASPCSGYMDPNIYNPNNPMGPSGQDNPPNQSTLYGSRYTCTPASGKIRKVECKPAKGVYKRVITRKCNS